jgi:hypothetical protein
VASREETLADGRLCAVHTFHADVAAGNPLNAGQPFYVLATDGLSDTPVVPDVPRTELVWYVAEPLDVHFAWLRALATIHTIAGEDLYQRAFPTPEVPLELPPLAPGSLLDAVTVLDAPLPRDRPEFRVGGSPTGCLWVLPLSSAERDLVAAGGVGALRDLLEKNAHPTVLDPLRRSYV